MIHRRGFLAGALSTIAIAFARGAAAQETKAAVVKPQLQQFHSVAERNLYFNVTTYGFDTALKEPLSKVTSFDEVKDLIIEGGESWGAYKNVVKMGVSALVPQIKDERGLRVLRNPDNFGKIRGDDSRRYSDSNLGRAAQHNSPVTNPLFAAIRMLSLKGIISAEQAVETIAYVNKGDFYSKELPGYIGSQAEIELSLRRQQGLAPSSFN